MRLNLDDFLAPGPAAQQPQQGDFQQAMSMEEQVQMMQWMLGLSQMQTDPNAGAAGFLPQADGQACLQAQACVGSGQAFVTQDYIGQLSVNPSAVPPPMTDVSAAQFVPSGAFDVGAAAFQMPFMPAQAPPPPLQPVPGLFAQPALAQAAGTVLQQAPAQPPPPQPLQAPHGPQQLQQMAMHIQKLLQIQQPAQPPGPQMPVLADAFLAAAFPALAGGGSPGAALAAALAQGPAATSAFASDPSGARWADQQEAMTAPMALPPFPVPMFPPAAEPGAAAQPPGGRVSISVAHFPEPGASTPPLV